VLGAPKLTRTRADFQTVLKQDPSSTEAKNALRETHNLIRERNDEDDIAVSDDERPLLSNTKVELESVSDSSDWNHEGNGIPCRFYNHEGCKRGNDCRFSHAPDHKSVRDRLYVFLVFPFLHRKRLINLSTVFGCCTGDATCV
jgi:hypothetical protein